MSWIEFIVLVGIVLLGYTLGWLLAEKVISRLAAKAELLDFEAFTCRQCLTFHLIWVPSIAFALYEHSWQVGVVGVGFAFIVWAGLKIDQIKKTRRLEDDCDK